ncbi:apolipoprotein N-acyltransferase [Hymenobacter profundi]|uniref:Apolipoprotein N-acyltransferase n=1 Tax=Hymenobacter profundi TaxID=1982110 RepID=A0ABS6X372_9BACT|nr:apolipoprotein N-acyltransferase [Hymenobacter profundi]MBW3130284.1 apolipoprotein N-acyltransferase [Hymenobacter profundi]MBW3130287.1 apolipoprotein N-acyltransferase [Hymenobacter profundi]
MATQTAPTSATLRQPAAVPAWQPASLALLSAALLWAGWPVHPAGLAALLLVGWVPYLRMEQLLVRSGANGWRVFRYTYLTLVLWNAFTTWWVSYSTLGGGIAAVVLNALLMCLPTMAFYHTKRLAGPVLGYLSLPVYWIAFEQLHLHWDLTWPWLTLGNGFAEANQWVQWYEYTGFLGGSLWIWVVNLLVFRTWFGEKKTVAPWSFGSERWRWVAPVLAVVLPISISLLIGRSYQEKGKVAEVLVIQPNVDPYNEKFSSNPNFIPYDQQLTRLLTLTEQNITPQTRLVFWPETALEEHYFEDSFDANPKIQRLRQWLGQYPGIELITGYTGVLRYPDAITPTARYRDDMGWYDVFNAATFLPGPTGAPTFYHKSRLVPGVEKIPPALTSIISHIDLGGTVGSYGSQEERTVFRSVHEPALRVAPLICYESIYGDFTAEYVKNGATLLGIITNDGWWSDSPGHLQHIQYATLRAIETRRDVARSANTGISGFIDQKGQRVSSTGWWVQAARRYPVHLNTEQTFYVRHGELLGPLMQILTGLLLAWTIVAAVRRTRPAL